MKNLNFIIALVSVFFVGYLAGRVDGRRRHEGGAGRVEVRTEIVHDTVRISGPVETRHIFTHDTLVLTKLDTVRLRDTVYYFVEREIRQYRDSLFSAQVSGYQPRLDWIEVYPETKTVYQFREPAKKVRPWGIGVQAGYGVCGESISFYVGVGISYNFVRW